MASNWMHVDAFPDQAKMASKILDAFPLLNHIRAMTTSSSAAT